MSERELIVLGSASQVPTRHRNHNGYLLRWNGLGFLFDPGEGTQRQMTRFGVPTRAITHVCVTHFHGDHCLGLPGILQRISLDRIGHPVTVCYPASGQVYFERLRHASIYDDQATIIPKPIHEDGVVAEIGAVRLEARRLDHRVDAYGYRVTEADSRNLIPARLAELGLEGPMVGQLKRDGKVEIAGRTVTVEEVSRPKAGQSAAIVMDTRVCDAATELARDVDLLICESTFLESEREKAREYGHMTARQAATLARESGARKLLLTHFSRRYPDAAAFEQEAKPVFEACEIARDGLVVPIPGRSDDAIAGG